MIEDDALVDAARADLEVALAERHFHGCVGELALQVLMELLDLH